MFARGLGIETTRKASKGSTSPNLKATKTASASDRRHTHPEAGPSRPRSICTITSEPVNYELEKLMSGEYDWERPPRETDSLITNQYCDLGDDPMPDSTDKGKEILDELPSVEGHCEGCNDQQKGAESKVVGSNPESTLCIQRILKQSDRESRHKLEKREAATVDFGIYDITKARTRALPSPPVSPRARCSEQTGQGGAVERLEDMRTQMELHAMELNRQHRQGGMFVRLRSPHRQADRWMKKLVRAVCKLLKALKETIASCLIIDEILALVCGLGELFETGKEDEMVRKAREVRGEVKQLCQELRERMSGSMRR